MKILYKNFIESFKILFSNWRYLGVAILADFLFIIAILTSWFFVSNRLIQNYDILQEMAGSINPESVAVGGGALQTLSGQLDVINNTIKGIYIYLFIFVLLIFVSFVLFNGFSWLITKYIVNKEKFRIKLDYFIKFSGLSFVWLLFLLLLFYFIFQAVSEDVNVKSILDIFVITYMIIWIYFAMLSYTYYLRDEKFWKSFKNAFLNGIKRIYIFVPLFVIIGFVFFILSFLFSFFINIPFFFIIPLVIFLVLCVWTKIYLLLVVKEL